ncbi:MAG TPA: glycosyltransferase, partial [Bacillota bacterium]|nr:glycosyltransferase [Bacillota bacterium]
DPRVKLIQLDGNFGQQNALLCGFQFASGDIWVTLDDDLQHPPEELPKLMTKLEEGYEAVFGIPNQKQHSGVRNLGSQVIDLLLTLIAHKPRSIKVSSFRVLNNRVGQAILNEDVSFVYLAPLIFRNTRCTANVIVRHEPRKFGRSNYSYGKLLKLAFKLVFFYSGLARFFPSPKGPQYKIRNILR